MDNQNFKLKIYRFLLLIIALSGIQLTASAMSYSWQQQNDTTKKDSLVTNPMSIKKNIQDRHINLWNRTIPHLQNVTGSSTIYGEDVNTTPVADISNVIAGRIPGLYSSRSSGRTGPMFDASSLTLRGQSPLIVVDGVVRSFTSFNVEDIKSITVMKDAVSTSMYGLRSSHGIIYITTKDQSDEKPFELNFSAQYGFLNQLKRPNFINGAQYAQLYNEAQQNTFPGAVPAYSSSTIASYQNGTNNPFSQPNNDWYNTIYKNNTAQQRYAINASGNGKSYRYYTSVEHFAQDGNFLTDSNNPYDTNNFYKRYNLRTNAQIDFNEDIQLSLNIFGSIENNSEPGAGASTIMDRIYGVSPLGYPARNADGSFGGNTQYTTIVDNVTYGTNILASTINSGYTRYNERTLSADVGLKFKLDDFVKGLWAKGILSINNYYLQRTTRIKNFAVYYPVTTPTGTTYTKIGSDGTIEANKGISSIDTQNKQSFFNGLVGYDKIFGKHTLNVLGTFNLTNLIDSYSQLNQIYQNAGVTASYNYDKTYLAEVGMVYSGYNRYKEGSRWGFLPSIALGWVVSNENWFNKGTLNFLKLRGSAGKTAWADPSNYYTYLQNYTVGSTSTGNYNFGSTPTAVNGSYENALSNPNITWEKSLKYDLALEAGFFKDKLNLELTYYNNKNTDELIDPANGYASGILGLTYPKVNAGQTRYSGLETSLSFNDKKGDFSYFVKGNFTVAKNKILSRAEGIYPYNWMYRAGQPSATFGYEAIGFYQVGEDVSKTANIPGYNPVAGDLKYKDLNGDGIINFLDQKAIAGDKPLVFFGFNFGFGYKNFDFSALLEGRVNREIYYDPTAMSAFYNSTGFVLDYTTENRWTPQNSVNAALPRLTLGTNTNNQQVSSFWVRNADYLRLKNVEIGYSVPQKWLKKAKLSKLRFFVNAYNVLTWTKLDYFDPETGLSPFPNYRVINGGVSLKL
nr:SusC/RagA family TonB-linked outer membrane protein [Pedobacter sp. ASV2]